MKLKFLHSQIFNFAVCSVAASVVPCEYLHDYSLRADRSLSFDYSIGILNLRVRRCPYPRRALGHHDQRDSNRSPAWQLRSRWVSTPHWGMVHLIIRCCSTSLVADTNSTFRNISNRILVVLRSSAGLTREQKAGLRKSGLPWRS